MVRNYIKKGGHGGARKCAEVGSTLFAITLNKVTWSKQETFGWLMETGYIQEMCVAEESYCSDIDDVTGEEVGTSEFKHHHIYIRSTENLLFDYWHEVLVTFTEDLGYDLQKCRKAQDWIRYITKEDWKPCCYHIHESLMSLFARTKRMCVRKYKEPNRVNPADPFYVAEKQWRRTCMDIAEDHMDELRSKKIRLMPTLPINMECKCVADLVYTFRGGSNMYVHGNPGIGKTELFEALIKEKKVFRCGTFNKFMFGAMKEDTEIILFEDFVWPQDRSQDPDSMFSRLLSIMTGKPVGIESKGKDATIKVFNVQCIFLSNEFIPSGKEMFERRCKIFNCYHNLFNCNLCGGFL
jgi:nucleoside-triphosphatase THEP1